MKKILLTLVVAFATLATMAQRADYRIIPLPKSEVTDTTQVFVLQSGMGIAYDASNEEVARNAAFLREWVQQVTGVQLVLSPTDEKAAIRLSLGFPADKKAKKGKKPR